MSRLFSCALQAATAARALGPPVSGSEACFLGRTGWTFDSGGNADHDSDGAGIGATLGYNWQLPNNVVLGIEGDLSWPGAEGDAACPNADFECHSKVTWLGTVRPRLGYAIDRFMPYVTGGAAFGKVNLWSPAGVFFPAISESHTAFGWAAGAGVEYAFTDHLTAKLEYRHVDLGKHTCFEEPTDVSRGQNGVMTAFGSA